MRGRLIREGVVRLRDWVLGDGLLLGLRVLVRAGGRYGSGPGRAAAYDQVLNERSCGLGHSSFNSIWFWNPDGQKLHFVDQLDTRLTKL